MDTRTGIPTAGTLRGRTVPTAAEGLWIEAKVTGESPATGELIGLTIRDTRTGRAVVDRAVFRPLGPVRGLDSRLAPGVDLSDALNRLPFSFYMDEITRFLAAGRILVGPHVARDLAFLEAQGVRVDRGLRDRSVKRELESASPRGRRGQTLK